MVRSVLVIFFILIKLNAQTLDTDQFEMNSNQIKNFYGSLKYAAVESFNPKTYNPWKVLVVGGVTAVCFFGADFEMKEEYVFEKHYPPFEIPKYMSNIGKIYDQPGPFYFTLATLGSIYGSGWYFNNSKLMRTSTLMAHSMLITGIFNTFLKMIIGRARPYVGRDPHNFKFFNLGYDADYVSMPSGHTSSIFSMMSVLAGQYDSYLVKIPAYTFAVAVAFQRVDHNKHWVSDVLFGGILGYLVGTTLSDREKRAENTSGIKPAITDKGIGLVISF